MVESQANGNAKSGVAAPAAPRAEAPIKREKYDHYIDYIEKYEQLTFPGQTFYAND